MSDLPYIQGAQEVKITGQDSSGNSVNYVNADANGNLQVKDAADGTVGAAVPALAVQVGGSDGTYLRSINTDVSGNQKIVGNVSSGSADSGNPIKIGGVYNDTLPVVGSGNRVDLQLDSNGRLLTSSVSLPTTASKFTFGQVSTSTVSQVPVELTAYTEPTTNSAMTLVSSSANDASAGTGARAVTVIYLDQTGAGPFATTFTMNGASPVTAGVSNMCFIEKIFVTTVGTTGSNAGILTLKTGSGTTVGTVSATSNETFWCHHYTPVGKISYITGFSIGNNGTGSGNGASFVLKSATPTVANTPEFQISDFVSCASATSTTTRTYNSPIQVVGPARIRAYVTSASTGTLNQNASFDFIDN